MTALKEMYRTEIVPKLQEELGLKNVMAVPRITKITLNMGVGEAVGTRKSWSTLSQIWQKLPGKSLCHKVSKVDCRLQDSGWLADRLQGHAAR